MAANDYHLMSRWRLLATPDEVFDLVSRSQELPLWWPAAFLDALQLEPAGETGLGSVVRMETRGWLPYTLHWHLRVDAMDPPHSFGCHVWGDFEGRGAWSFAADGAWTDVSFDWRVRVRKPVVRYLSFLGRPLFISNHRWAMAKGEESLRLALARRHTSDPALRAALAPPPAAASSAAAWGIAAIGCLAGLLLLRGRR